MPHSDSQAFLRELDKKLWTAADRLRSNLDAAAYKHAVLGLIFLKYVSDSFAQRQAEIAVGVPPSGSASQTGLACRQIEAMLRDPDSDFYMNPADHKKPDTYEEAIRQEFEERDYHIEKNVFWVPALARWKTVQDSAKLPPGTEITVTNGKTSKYKITSTGKLIDDALDAIEKENEKLKGMLGTVAAVYNRRTNSRRSIIRSPHRARSRTTSDGHRPPLQAQIDPANLGVIIDLIATITFCSVAVLASHGSATVVDRRYMVKDMLGHVYEYFLGQWSGTTWTTIGSPQGWRGGTNQFALAEGKKGGQYFRPKSIVSLIVEMIEPNAGRVYDPARCSGGFFVQSERFIEEHGGKLGNLSVYGQEQRVWGARFGRAKRACRVRLRRKQPNQSNPTTWCLTAMKMVIRGIDFKEWWNGKLEWNVN